MKKSFLLMSVLASLFMAGCSQEDFVPNSEGENTSGESTTSYLSVNLVSSDATTTRADGDLSFENGIAAENKVNKVRFYFFTSTGAAAAVKLTSTGYVNYYDWTPNSQTSGTNGSNVGSMLDATLVIETPKGDKLPAQIAAVINPAEGTINRSLTTLKGLQKDYASTTYTTEGTFVMFNSVYGNATNTAEICAVPIEEKHLKKTSAEAIGEPVTIFVERCVAKVTVTMQEGMFNATTGLLALKDKNNKQILVGNEQVYLKIHGWKLAAETDLGNLVKDIEPASWTELGWWNQYSNKRSCWAVNASNADNRYWSYNQITPSDDDNYDFNAPLYTNENADDYATSPLNRTKVILSGTLCHENGQPFTIVRHLGTLMADTYSTTEADNLKNLKTSILTQLTADTKYYWKDGDTFKSITENDLQIVPVTLDAVENETAHDCFVYTKLTDVAAARSWYTANTEGATELANGSNVIDNLLADHVDKALVWNSGMTYYYYEIIHNINKDTENKDIKTPGVVRNHVYKTTVTGIAGLGTPVYNPNQKIYPEKPDPNDHYIAAKINILAWHIVNNDYNLVW